ncbi:hypothetical protein GH733_016723 [Mirounga leonina]|nr:hypothetical protein GH733_016723 [Mirounga leonina]
MYSRFLSPRPFSNPDPECSVSLAELDAEHTQKVLEMEHAQQAKLKERQKFFEEAFQQDMEQYLSTGYLQIAERRGNSPLKGLFKTEGVTSSRARVFPEPMGSMSSMEVNIDMLEQMDLMDISDQEALDVFLNSGGEDNTALSPVSGPTSGVGRHDITLQVPRAAESQAARPSSLSVCSELAAPAPRDRGESPIVQSDEEGVEVDTALATLHTDDSDS